MAIAAALPCDQRGFAESLQDQAITEAGMAPRIRSKGNHQARNGKACPNEDLERGIPPPPISIMMT